MDTDVAIIGAGPAGLALACALAGSGLRVTLLERAPEASIADPAFDGREIALTHRSQAILRELGAWDHIPMAETAPLREAKVLNGASPLALRFAPGRAGEPLGRLVPNQLIRRALFQVAATTEARLVADHAVTGLALAPQGATVTLEGGEAVTARLVVAADSRFSQARRLAGIGAATLDFGRSMIVARVAHEAPHGGVATEWFGHGQTIAMLPLNGAMSSAVLTLPPAEAEAAMAMTPEAFGAEVTRRYAGRLGAMTLAGTRHLYPLVATYAHRFIGRRFALLGDAAVGMHPVTAHGFNFGLSGADLLAGEIRGASDPGAVTGLFRYAAAHRRATLPLFVATNAVARLYSDDRAPARLARAALIGAGAVLAPVRRAIVAGLMDAAPLRAATKS
ncbi:5-demethoxyubiquinol-8 5-hydroxylase UbiM [Falsiroseomonas sp.]|uniref:5-demethoxyubiquinol-8 5-hydroxylase UbiM n=1 Tax=Falsiroseomonas sp. TaxID=2870721 RepID=UPI00273345BF|nr:5-demethoxyubiquinol-8 5-hydroxylase UbiM [Falsiroseomonas sp.]MDP3414531.1 5-demethoxyubiquinol-8 5-hydroxylase UbiM [Falsiroseomonas sp.]